jgi:hypothetical protein
MTSTCNNSFYTRIQAFGTASAFDPHYITKAGSVGPPNGASCDSSSSQNSTKTIDVDVNLSEASACKIYCLGNEIPRNAIIQNVSLNAHQSISDSTFNAMLGFGVSASGSVGCARDIPTLVFGYLEGIDPGSQTVYENNKLNHGAYHCSTGCSSVYSIITNDELLNMPCTGAFGNVTSDPNIIDAPIFPVLQIVSAATPPTPSPCCPCPCPPIINAKITYFCP